MKIDEALQGTSSITKSGMHVFFSTSVATMMFFFTASYGINLQHDSRWSHYDSIGSIPRTLILHKTWNLGKARLDLHITWVYKNNGCGKKKLSWTDGHQNKPADDIRTTCLCFLLTFWSSYNRSRQQVPSILKQVRFHHFLVANGQSCSP